MLTCPRHYCNSSKIKLEEIKLCNDPDVHVVIGVKLNLDSFYTLSYIFRLRTSFLSFLYVCVCVVSGNAGAASAAYEHELCVRKSSAFSEIALLLLLCESL